MDCNDVRYSQHAIQRMFARAIDRSAVLGVLRTGKVIEDYPHDTPLPSRLLLGFMGNTPLHVVVAYDQSRKLCVIVTTYVPEPTLWEADWSTRRKP